MGDTVHVADRECAGGQQRPEDLPDAGDPPREQLILAAADQVGHVDRHVKRAIAPAGGQLLLVDRQEVAIDARLGAVALAADRLDVAGLAVQPAHLLQTEVVILLLPLQQVGVDLDDRGELEDRVVQQQGGEQILLDLLQLAIQWILIRGHACPLSQRRALAAARMVGRRGA